MKNSRKLYSAETLSKAGIPINLCWSGSNRSSVVNLRTAICFLLVVRLNHPQIYVADLLQIQQGTVSKCLKRHYLLFPVDEDYSSIYLSAEMALEIAGILKPKNFKNPYSEK